MQIVGCILLMLSTFSRLKAFPITPKPFRLARLHMSIENSREVNVIPKIVFVLGGPGAGKGTQCEKLSKEFGILHLSAGELLREERKRPTEYGKTIDNYLKDNKIVPVEISLSLLRQAIVENKWNRYLIDGFPRNWDNLEGWNREMNNICEIETVMFIDCHEEHLERRIIQRGLSSGRADDNIEALRRRLAIFRSEEMPVVTYFQNNHKDKFVAIDGDSDVDTVYEAMRVPIVSNIDKEVRQLTTSLIADKMRSITLTNSIDVKSCDIEDVHVRGTTVELSLKIAKQINNSGGQNNVEQFFNAWSASEDRKIVWTLRNGQWQSIDSNQL